VSAAEKLAESLAMTLDADKVHAAIVIDAPKFFAQGGATLDLEMDCLKRDLLRELDAWKARQS
jgi:hypothetical protein